MKKDSNYISKRSDSPLVSVNGKSVTLNVSFKRAFFKKEDKVYVALVKRKRQLYLIFSKKKTKGFTPFFSGATPGFCSVMSVNHWGHKIGGNSVSKRYSVKQVKTDLKRSFKVFQLEKYSSEALMAINYHAFKVLD